MDVDENEYFKVYSSASLFTCSHAQNNNDLSLTLNGLVSLTFSFH